MRELMESWIYTGGQEVNKGGGTGGDGSRFSLRSKVVCLQVNR